MSTIPFRRLPKIPNRFVVRNPEVGLGRLAAKGNKMTVALGFRCDDGVVLCADTQITKEGGLKYYRKKTFKIDGGPEWSAGFTYAGNPDAMDLLMEKMCDRLSPDGIEVRENGEVMVYLKPTYAVVRRVLEDTLSEISKKHKRETDWLETLCAVSISGQPPVFLRTKRTLVTEAEWECLGLGDSSLARYLAATFHWPQMTTGQALLLGIYMTQQAKRYVNGCGGDTDALVLGYGGAVEEIERGQTAKMEQYLELAVGEASSLLAVMMRTELSDSETNLLLEQITLKVRDLKAGFSSKKWL